MRATTTKRALILLLLAGLSCRSREPDVSSEASNAPGSAAAPAPAEAAAVSLAIGTALTTGDDRGLRDENPAPNILEVSIEARPGVWELAPDRSVRALTYNGTVPGPTLAGRVGDRVLVHFTNRLDEPTTIHWHGLRVSAEMDGSPAAQNPVPAGGRFDYEFTLTDAGTFWYHPHAHEADQMARGMYGAIVVRGPDEPMVDAEKILMLDDVRLDEDGQIAPPDERDIRPGRKGDLLVVNGRLDYELPARSGDIQRWRLINVANARYFRVGLDDQPLTIIGSDGGFAEQPTAVERLLLTPGDRYDVLVRAEGASGHVATLTTESIAHGHGHWRGTVQGSEPLLKMQYLDMPPRPRHQVTVPQSVLPDLTTEGLEPQLIRLGGGGCCGAGAAFTINGHAYPDVPPIHARVDQTQLWDIVNATGMDHPFHLHGFFFQVIERTGEPEPVRAWEDNINIARGERVRIAFRPDARPGRWLYHCHILEHAEHGMTAELVVDP